MLWQFHFLLETHANHQGDGWSLRVGRPAVDAGEVFGDFADHILQSLQAFVEELRAPQLAPGAALVAAAGGAKETKRDRVRTLLATGLDVFEAMSPANCKRVMELATLVLNKADQPWGDSGAFLATTRVRDLLAGEAAATQFDFVLRAFALLMRAGLLWADLTTSQKGPPLVYFVKRHVTQVGASASLLSPSPPPPRCFAHTTLISGLCGGLHFCSVPFFAASKTLPLFPPVRFSSAFSVVLLRQWQATCPWSTFWSALALRLRNTEPSLARTSWARGPCMPLTCVGWSLLRERSLRCCAL